MYNLFSILSLFLIPPTALAGNAADAIKTAVSPFFSYMLAAHVIFGVIGVMALYAVWMMLLKRGSRVKVLVWTSFAALVSLVASWISGGVYYVGFYGDNVKPIIKAGEYKWAHSLITETKEHVFLFLPFLAAVLFVILLMRGDELEYNARLRRNTAYLAGLASIIGILITLAGVVISGAAG